MGFMDDISIGKIFKKSKDIIIDNVVEPIEDVGQGIKDTYEVVAFAVGSEEYKQKHADDVSRRARELEGDIVRNAGRLPGGKPLTSGVAGFTDLTGLTDGSYRNVTSLGGNKGAEAMKGLINGELTLDNMQNVGEEGASLWLKGSGLKRQGGKINVAKTLKIAGKNIGKEYIKSEGEHIGKKALEELLQPPEEPLYSSIPEKKQKPGILTQWEADLVKKLDDVRIEAENIRSDNLIAERARGTQALREKRAAEAKKQERTGIETEDPKEAFKHALSFVDVKFTQNNRNSLGIFF